MSPKRCPRRATQAELRVALYGHFRLEELFTEEQLVDLMTLARNRILSSFYRATEKRSRSLTGPERTSKRNGFRRPYYLVIGTDNYIIGIEGLQSELARHVSHRMKQFVHSRDLPNWVGEVSDKLTDTLIAHVQQKVLLAVLNQMCTTAEVWYDDARGIWQVCQTAVDQYLEVRAAAKATLPLNDRSYHGRPRRQTRARGIPEGTSVGLGASQSMTA